MHRGPNSGHSDLRWSSEEAAGLHGVGVLEDQQESRAEGLVQTETGEVLETLHPSFSRVDMFVLWGLCSCVIESQAVTGFHLACFYIPVMSEVTGSETRSPSHSGSAETEGTFVLSQQNFLLLSLLLSVLMMLIFTLTSHTENKPTLASNLQKVVELHSGKHFDLKKRK